MLRETTFLIGGIVTVALGVLLGVALYLAGAGPEYSNAWLASGIAVGLGGFFVYVARDEHRTRLEFLRASEEEPSKPPGSSGP
ncbi:MAG TPA: hypothetical protein VEE83_03705 [Thermoplasmata archaeon]|nr:hypothetical protein [Thermoplasmata archaeon]